MKKNNSEDAYSSESDNSDEIDDKSNDTEDEKQNRSSIIKQFTAKEICYYKMINDFFEDKDKCNDKDIEKMILMIKDKDKKSQKSEISLRLLDWLVTKYSKKLSIFVKTIEGDKQNLKLCYKSTLKTYKKRYFDPFKRKNKGIKFWHYYTIKGKEYKVWTTIGQLNFFKWAIYNGVIRYVEENMSTLCKEMKKSNSEDKKRKENDSTSDTSESNSKSKKSIDLKKNKKSTNQVGIKNGKLEISFD